MTRPRVAIDSRLVSGSNTGDSSYWTGLLHGLSQSDTGIEFLLFSNAARPEGIPESDQFQWIQLSSHSSRWWSFVSFPLAARRMGAKAIHTQYSLSPLVQRGGVTTIHDISFLIGPQWFKLKDRLILQRTVPASARRAAAIIAVSKTCQREIEDHIPASRGKVRAIYNGLPPWIKRDENPGARLEALGIESPYLLTVGTRWPRKNMELAIEAVGLLGGKTLVVTGKPGWGDQAAPSHVRPTGYVSYDDLCSLYSGASLYLAPSLHEGFGIPVIEAFACGCPVLASSGGALPEIVGEAGVVEPHWDASHWAGTIEAMLGDSGKLNELRRRGIERAKEFDWKKFAEQTADVYREVIG
jgi:glycosyltransferase involved in cell wall biosynthesis